MKQGLEGRLRKLEQEYIEAPDAFEVIGMRWLTFDETKRGLLPGLYGCLPEDRDSPVLPASIDSCGSCEVTQSDVQIEADEKV